MIAVFKPQTILIRGVNIKGKILEEDVERIDMGFHLETFCKENKQYTNERGWLNVQIVKHKQPTPTHTHFMRVATSNTIPCHTDGIFPKKPNELK